MSEQTQVVYRDHIIDLHSDPEGSGVTLFRVPHTQTIHLSGTRDTAEEALAQAKRELDIVLMTKDELAEFVKRRA